MFSLTTGLIYLKNATLGFEPTDVNIPDEKTYRYMDLTGMFQNTNVSKDISITKNILNVINMFNGCKNMKTYVKNWEKNLRQSSY